MPVVLTPLISWKWAWWMFAVHPQHLVLRRINVEVASRMETDKKGDFFLDQSKDWTTQDLHIWGFNFAFLPWLHSMVLLSFPWNRLLAYFALPLLSHCHWNTKSPTYSLVSCPRLSDHPSLEAFTALQCLRIKYPLTLLQSQSPYFEQPQTTKKGQAAQAKEPIKQIKWNLHLISWSGWVFFDFSFFSAFIIMFF